MQAEISPISPSDNAVSPCQEITDCWILELVVQKRYIRTLLDRVGEFPIIEMSKAPIP